MKITTEILSIAIFHQMIESGTVNHYSSDEGNDSSLSAVINAIHLSISFPPEAVEKADWCFISDRFPLCHSGTEQLAEVWAQCSGH